MNSAASENLDQTHGANRVVAVSPWRWSSVADEFRLVGPVVAAWFGIWLALLIASLTANGYSEVRERAMVTISCLGIASTVMWCCLYGQFNLRRVATGLLLIVVVTTFAAMLGNQIGRSGMHGEMPMFIVGAFFVGLLAFVPGWCLRRFLRWQICPFSELKFEHDRRFRIQELFFWTAAVAGLLALFPMFDEILFSNSPGNGSFVAYFIAIAIVFPTFAAMTFFTLLSSLRDRYLVIAIPILTLVLSLLNSVVFLRFSLPGNYSLEQALREFFWPTMAGFLLAGYSLLAMVWYLRRSGLYFKVGLVDHRACATRSKQEYEDSLRRRIDHASELSRRLEASQAIDIKAR